MGLSEGLILLNQGYYSIIIASILIVLVFSLVRAAYYYGLKKASDITGSNTKGDKLPDTSQQLNALINSLNDIIFEFNEDKVCLQVWFNEITERVVDPKQCVGKKLADILGIEKAKKFDNAIDYVIANKKGTSVEYISDFGTGNWYIAKITPVFDRHGNYTSRISASVSDISEQKKYAGALKENEILLLEAQAVAKIGNWWYDAITDESYWSENLYSILELEQLPQGIDEFAYYLSLVHPDDRESYSQYISTLLMPDVENQFGHRLIIPGGKLKYIKVIKGDLLLDDAGNVKRVFGIIQDVTETKLSERAIKRGRTELIEAQTIAKIGNWNWNTTSHKLSWSDEIANIYEIAPPVTTTKGVIRFLFKHVHKHDKFVLQHLFKSAVSIINYTCVFRIITPAGTIKYVSIIIGKQLKNDDGSIRKIIGTLQDVTDRKQAEIDYRRAENKYKLVLETIKLAALSIDNRGSIIFCNQYLANLLGYSQKEILGMQWVGNFLPTDLKGSIENWFTNNTLPTQNINPIICRNGERRIMRWQNTVSYDENGLVKETTSIGEDITDQQRATQELITAKELAERSSQFKSDFLSIMSHEIRTPMNAVIGITNLLLSEQPKPEQLEYLNILKFSGENLLAIINDILDYNKIEAGKLELHQLKFNLHLLAQKTTQSFYARATEKELDLELIIDESIPEFIIGDQMRLSQILNNLISNAVKFTKKGKVSIQLQTISVSNEQIAISFTVFDTGIGIADKNLDIIFDPFIQEPLVNNNTGGTGLGLAITKRLVNLHQSDISVISELGVGSQFSFAISFNLPEDVLAEPLPINTNPSPMLNLQGMNILIVDDNKMNLLVASSFLKKWQAKVDEALNGQLAVDMVNINPYDLIIMDLQMPVMDGFEATTAIKSSFPQMPIIALTADAMPETYNKAILAGMCDYLTKPFVPATLFDKVAKHYKQV